MSEHTKEPWSFSEGVGMLKGPYGQYIAGTTGNNRRIVACVNALANISTEWLEENKSIVVLGAPIADRFREIEAQRDELLAALKLWKDTTLKYGYQYEHTAMLACDAAIAKAEARHA